MNPELAAYDKPLQTPILEADTSYRFQCPMRGAEVAWQAADVFNPAAVVREGKVWLLYRSEDDPKAGLGGRSSRIGLAWSSDGVHFTKEPHPVLYPGDDALREFEHPGGCEDPRVVETQDGGYVMTYTAWNHQTARLCIATSRDLRTWTKHGPAFAQAHNGRLLAQWSKSGAILTALRDGRPVAIKHQGRYWMYWGEHAVNLATSEDMIHWTPTLRSDGELAYVLEPRSGKFDSRLAEAGPPALLTEAGIVLLYNGKNAEGASASSEVPPGTYATGWARFDPAEPSRLIARSDLPILRPTLPHECSGQYAAGTTFAEGWVFFQERWWLYYGTADSFVGVARTQRMSE